MNCLRSIRNSWNVSVRYSDERVHEILQKPEDRSVVDPFSGFYSIIVMLCLYPQDLR